MSSTDNVYLYHGSYSLGQDIIYRKVDDELIIINLKTDKIFSLNQTGARFFELLASQIELGKIKEILLNQYDVNQDELDREIITILDSFSQEGIIYAI